MTDVGKLDMMETYDNDELSLPATIPDPSGSWYLVVYPVSMKAKITAKSGVSFILPDTVLDSAQALMTVGLVVRKGKMCYKWNQYKDPATGEYYSWCDVGDWVVFGRDSNARAVMHSGKKFWILPDEAILYKVKHPNEVNPQYEFDQNEIDAMVAKIKEMNANE